MKILGFSLAAVIVAVLAVLIWVRVAPIATGDVHIAPDTADSPQGAGIRLRGDRAVVFASDPAAVISALEGVALQTRRVTLVASTQDPLRITFEARTKWLRFPDHLTFEAHPVEGGTRLDVLARARFAGYDWGVNAARVDHWLTAVRDALGQG